MNLETLVDKRIWESIEQSYKAGSYSSAIKDAMHFLSDLIREKSGLEGDGVALIGNAFGGKSPKLKVNKMQTESEQNVQKGIEQLLRGLYQAIRNPRSHGKTKDPKSDADAIILFINYLITIIGASRGVFSPEDFLLRVFDPDFYANKKYGQLLTKEIPTKKRFDIFVTALRKKSDGDPAKLYYFFSTLYAKLSDDEQNEIRQIISDDLKIATSDEEIIAMIRILPVSCWQLYDEVARLRIENKLLMSIKEGKYHPSYDSCYGGLLGTCTVHILSSFSMMSELELMILEKLYSSNESEEEYILRYFFDYMPEIISEPSGSFEVFVNQRLEDGDVRYRDALFRLQDKGFMKWVDVFGPTLAVFKELLPGTPSQDSDDLPF